VLQFKLEEIIDKSKESVELIFGDLTQLCTSIEYDSRKVRAGAVFVAVSGYISDGHDYIEAAITAGAKIVVVDKQRAAEFHDLEKLGITLLTVNSTRRALSFLSAAFYGDVSKKIPVIGVTGTNGKTSITYMLEAIFKKTGMNPGVLGTVDYRWSQTKLPAPNTTPESKDLHEIMFRMYSENVDIIVMEVSSHGLQLGRVDDIEFVGGIFTNLTLDHLDFHKTFDEYFNAKKILFELINKSDQANRFAVINSDDNYGQKLLKECQAYNYDTVSYALNDQNADYLVAAGSIDNHIDGIAYSLKNDDKNYQLDLHLSGMFNIYNSIAAFAAADKLGINSDDIIDGLTHMKTVPGRFDRIKTDYGFSVVIDYAHTNDALEKLLSAVKELNPKKIITVFGCGGDRDNSKRPIMGEIAVRYSDYSIITSDNPRNEDPLKIIDDIQKNISAFNNKYEVIVDREKAIAQSVKIANSGDIVVIAGKGHEDYQVIGKNKIHFDDKEITEKYIGLRNSLES
jgi:UDP-N-acetylmuramoyl-L-alanyl-D-glutamate--2,6-diaminopimelate ligase